MVAARSQRKRKRGGERVHVRSLLYRQNSLRPRRRATARRHGEEPVVEEPTGATLVGFDVEIAQVDLKRLKDEGTRTHVGLQLVLYSSSTTTAFATNQFTLLATCLLPVIVGKPVLLPKQFVRPASEMSVLVLRIVRTKDVAMMLAFQDEYVFAPSKMPEDAKPLRGSELLKVTVACRQPMTSNLVRFDTRQRRAGEISVVLEPVASKMLEVVKVAFEVKWDAQSIARKTQRLETIVTRCFPRISTFREDFQFISRRRRLGATRAAALDRIRHDEEEEEKAGDVEKADV